MGTDLVVAAAPASLVLAQLAVEVDRARSYAQRARAESTTRAYAGEWKLFEAWCAERGAEALPAAGELVAVYLAGLADQGRRAAGIEVALVAISAAHRLAGLPNPREHRAVQEVRSGIRRVIGTAQKGKEPLLVENLRASVAALPDRLRGMRDRALLLVGFAGAFRRSELVGLDLVHVKERPEGMIIHLAKSKTDQEGHGRDVAISKGACADTCPVHALQAWIAAAAIREGAIFRSVSRWGHVGKRLSPGDVARAVKSAAAAAGLDAAELAGHSLRSGLATSAARAGATEREIMRKTGHKSVAMVRRYIRDGDAFSEDAARGLL